MNQEAQFGLRFVVKDLAKMRKAMEEMNKNLQKMQKNAAGASKNVDKLNTSFGKATRSVIKFTAAYFALSKIIGTVFSKAQESIQLDLMAQSAGVAVDKIGKLGKALRYYGGDARAAGAAYASLTNIIGGAQHGMGISEDVQRVNAMYGIGFNYGNISQEQLITEIAKSMHRLRGNKDQFAINQIAAAYGIDDSMAALLAEKGANWSKFVNAQKVVTPKKSDAVKLMEAEQELKDKLNEAIIKLTPALTKLADATVRLVNWLETHFKENPNRKTFDEQGNYTQLGKDNSFLSRNKETGEYTVLDKDMNLKYHGKNPLKAEQEYAKLNYEPSWWDKKVVKPFWNMFGVDTPMIDNVLNKEHIQIELVNNTGNKIDLGKVKSNGEKIELAPHYAQ